MLTRTLVGHELGVWGLCLVSRGGYRLADPHKSRAKRTKTRSTSSGKAESSDPSLEEHKKSTSRSPSTQDLRASSSKRSMRSLRARVAGIDLHPQFDDRDGMHVMPSESLEVLISPAMRIALGLDALSDSEHEDNEDGHSGCGADVEPILHEREDSTHRHDHARRRGSAEEEDLPGIGVDPARNPDKPSSMCYSSQGWGQPNSLIISGGCDKVVRVWDAESG